jgi:hypothetical protein
MVRGIGNKGDRVESKSVPNAPMATGVGIINKQLITSLKLPATSNQSSHQ